MARRGWIGASALAVVVVVGAGIGAAFATGAIGHSKPPPTAAQIAAEQAAKAAAHLRREERRAVVAAEQTIAVRLPRRTDPPSRAPSATTLFRRPLAPVEVLGFVPYWEADQLSPADLSSSSLIAIFGVEVSASGGFVESGPGWEFYADGGYRTLALAAHAKQTGALFTISSTSPRVIRRLVRDPGPTSARLASALSAAVSDNDLDGVDIDLEGNGQSGRAGFVVFVRDLVRDLHSDGMHGRVVLDCYPQSAGESTDFFDIAKLAPLVDQVFVMAYDMEQSLVASPTAPLASADLGLSDVQALIQYEKVVPARKLILGVPFYGVDFTTASARQGAPTLTPVPEEETYATIAAAGRTALWDPVSRTVWTRFRRGKHWHETWFDDPLTIALKRALAARFHLAGIGVWALGQEGADSSMLEALDGDSPPRRLALAEAG